MISKFKNAAKHHVFSKMIAQLSEVERVVDRTNKDDSDTQLTFLFKLGKHCFGEDRKIEGQSRRLKNYWKKLLGPTIDFGSFYNRDIGTIFIAGPLSEIFLQDVDGKKLGAFTEGPYGILRGLGLNHVKASVAIKKLNEGQYLLLGKIKNQVDYSFMNTRINLKPVGLKMRT